MKNDSGKKKGEWEMLTHEAVPGYKAVFYTIFSIAIIYFIFIFAH